MLFNRLKKTSSILLSKTCLLTYITLSSATSQADFNGFITTDILPLTSLANEVIPGFDPGLCDLVGPVSVATADFNNSDNQGLAIVSTNGTDSLLFIYIGDGTGNFDQISPYIIDFPGMIATSMIIGDFDNSDSPAIAIAGSQGGAAVVQLVDVDSLPCFPFLSGTRRQTVCNVPFLFDAVTPVITLSSIPSFEGIAIGPFNTPTNSYLGLALTGTDLDTGAGMVYIYLGNGDNTFSLGNTYPVGLTPLGIASGPISNAPYYDLVTANYDQSSISLLKGLGNGSFSITSNLGVSGSPVSVSLGDFNGDDNNDIAVVSLAPHGNGNYVDIFLNNEEGNFIHPAPLFIEGSAPSNSNPGISVGNFSNNDNGWDDLAVTAGDNIKLLFSKGDGTFTPLAIAYTTGQLPVCLAAADFNNDSFLDLVAGNQGNDTVTILIQNVLGSGTPGIAVNTQTIIIGGKVAYSNVITWGAVTTVAGQPVCYYEVFKNGVLVDTVSVSDALKYVDYNVQPDSSITYTIVAYNCLGQSSAPSSMVVTASCDL